MKRLTDKEIRCVDCWKTIQLKNWRIRCIKCSNIRDKQLAEQRRNNPEYKKMYMEKYKEKRGV